MAEHKTPAEAKAAFFALVALAVVGCVLDVGVIGWILTPICILLGAFAIARAPLKITMLTLMFFALTLENPAEVPAAGAWESPIRIAGALMLSHFKTIVGGFWFFGGMDLMLGAAILVAYTRRRSLRKGLGTPQPMIKLAYLTYAAIIVTFVVGKWHGGDTSKAVWQIDKIMYLPAIFLLCQAAFTGPADYLSVGKVALAAATLRSLQAMYVRAVVPAKIDPITGESDLPYTTTHNDSMLFAVGTIILVSLVLQRAGRQATRLTWLLLPILVGGMLANTRRLVWVEIIFVFIILYLMTDTNAFKRKLNRAMLISGPIGLIYLAVGWSSTAGIFKPVQTIRSAVDSSSDQSTAWRDLENFNLIYTIRQFPLFGVGYGNEFWEMWPMPYVEYELEKYIPHNSVLGLFCYGGYFGAVGVTALWVAGVFFAIRAYHFCKEPLEKAAALACMASVLVYYLQGFGDLGIGSWTGVYLVAPSIAIACKLAVKNGAWDMTEPVRKAARRFVPSRGPA